jgi:hypothetical protein
MFIFLNFFKLFLAKNYLYFFMPKKSLGFPATKPRKRLAWFFDYPATKPQKRLFQTKRNFSFQFFFSQEFFIFFKLFLAKNSFYFMFIRNWVRVHLQTNGAPYAPFFLNAPHKETNVAIHISHIHEEPLLST